MIQPKAAWDRQLQACFGLRGARRFAAARNALNTTGTRVRSVLVLFVGAFFRNPSPWRQSGANLHLLPLFSKHATAKRNFERDLLCPKQLSFSRPLRWSHPLAPVCSLIHKFKPPQVVQPLAQPQPQLQAVTPAKLSRAALSARQRVRFLTNSTFCFERAYTHETYTTLKRRFAPIGQGGVSCFQTARKGPAHV